MLPASLLSCDLRGDAAIPRFLSDADRPWIRALLDECERAAARPLRELEARLRQPIPGAPDDKRRMAAHLLLGFARSRVASAVPPREARAALFTAAARAGGSRDELVAGAAADLGVSPGALLVDKITEQLFADGSIDAIESCSPEGSFMNQLWDGRRPTVDMLVDVGVRKSLGFRAVMASERGYAQLRGLRNRLRDMSWAPHAWRKGAAISR